MKHTVTSTFLLLTFFALVTPTWAADDPSCHKTATQPVSDPKDVVADSSDEAERLDFFANCKEKGNVASYCKHLTTTIRQRDGTAGNNKAIKYFVADKGPCKDKDSVQAYCKLWSTYDGLKILIDESDGYDDPMDPDLSMPSHIVDRSAKLCGTTRDALLAKFCTAAAASKSTRDRDLAVQACPKEGKEIYMRNCVGKVYENMTATPKQCEEEYNRIAKKF